MRRVRLIHLALGFAAAVLAPLTATAHADVEDKSFTFPEVRIDATILADGSMDLVEDRTFLFTGGTFSVGTFGVDWPHDLVEGFRVSQDGAPLNVRDVSSGTFFQAEYDFPQFETGRQTFEIAYRVRCAVRVYTDRAHLYWQFVGTADAGTDHVLVTVHVPGAALGSLPRPDRDCPPPPAEPPGNGVIETRSLRPGEVLAKGFGPANGTFRLNDPQTVVFEVRDVPAGGFVEGSILMPPASVPLAFQQDHAIGNREIGREPFPGEKTGFWGWFASRHNRHLLALWLLLGLPVFWLLVVIAARVRDRMGAPNDVTEAPEPIDPVDLAVMWGKLRGQTFSTTAYGTEILHLARTGVIDMVPEGTVSDPTDFQVRLTGEPQTDVDRDFVSFVFGRDGKAAKDAKTAKDASPARPDEPVWASAGDAPVSLNSLRHKGGSRRFKKWSNDLTARMKARLGRVPKQEKRFGKRLIAWSALGGTAAGIALSVSGGDVAGLPQLFIWEAILLGGGLALAVPPRLDPEFRARMAPWRGFRKYLKDFSSLPDAPALAVVIWERYLEYAAALGVAKEVAEQVGSLVPVERLPSPWPGAPGGANALVWVSAFHTASRIPPSSAVSSSSSSSHGISSFSSSGGSFSGGGGGGGGGTHAGAR
ncbi:MAG TPA: DUF2207 domain-containing protein [Actinomycetota bacterium]